MEAAEFRAHARALGYGEAETREYEAGRRGALHSHPFSALLLVLCGAYALAYADRTVVCAPGEVHEVPAGTLHDERSGQEGATVLLAKK